MVRFSYLKFSNPDNFEKKITKKSTFKTAVHLEEHILCGGPLIFFKENCILIKTSNFRELVLNSCN